MTQLITELPLYSEPYHEYRIALEDQARVVTFRWQDRTSSWYIDLKQDDLTPIVLGVRIVPYYPILADYQLQEKGINGYFVLVDKGDFISDKLNTSPQSLSQFYRLFYIYEDED
jgi:hypothetical protein